MALMLPFSALAAPSLVNSESQSTNTLNQLSDSLRRLSDPIKMSLDKAINQDKMEKRSPKDLDGDGDDDGDDEDKCDPALKALTRVLLSTWMAVIGQNS